MEWLSEIHTQIKNLYGCAMHLKRAGNGGEGGEINL